MHIYTAINDIASLSSGLVKLEFSQTPDPVGVGGMVKVECKATADGKKVHHYSWTDGHGEDIVGNYSSRHAGVYVLTVNESKLDKSKVVVCVVTVEVDDDLKQEKDNYTVHVDCESCM